MRRISICHSVQSENQQDHGRVCKHCLHRPLKWARDAAWKCVRAGARTKLYFTELNSRHSKMCRFDKQLNLTSGNFDSYKKKREQEMRGKMCLHTFPLVNGVNRERKCRTLITCAFYLSAAFLYVSTVLLSLHLSLLPYTVIQRVTIQTPHSVTVTVLRGSLVCLVIQLKQWDPTNPRNISIMLLTECQDAKLPGNIHTHTLLFACLLPHKPATLDMRQEEPIWSSAAHPTSPNLPLLHPRTSPDTPESRQKLESKAFWETGSSIMKAKCVL